MIMQYGENVYLSKRNSKNIYVSPLLPCISVRVGCKKETYWEITYNVSAIWWRKIIGFSFPKIELNFTVDKIKSRNQVRIGFLYKDLRLGATRGFFRARKRKDPGNEDVKWSICKLNARESEKTPFAFFRFRTHYLSNFIFII